MLIFLQPNPNGRLVLVKVPQMRYIWLILVASTVLVGLLPAPSQPKHLQMRSKYSNRKPVRLLRCAPRVRHIATQTSGWASNQLHNHYEDHRNESEQSRITQAQELKVPKVLMLEQDPIQSIEEEEGESSGLNIDGLDDAEEEQGDVGLQKRSLEKHAKRFARQTVTSTDIQSTMDNLRKVIEDLLKTLSGAGQSSTSTSPIEQALGTVSNLGSGFVRQTSQDLPQNLANVGKFLVNLLALLTVNNPIISNSPRLTRLRESSNGLKNDSIVADEILRRLRAALSGFSPTPRPSLSTTSAPDSTTTMDSTSPKNRELEEIRFVRRLNELTERDTASSTKVSSQRSRRSIGHLLLMGPLSKLYMTMWFHRMMRQQSGVLTQVLMGELLRRFVLPVVLPGATRPVAAQFPHPSSPLDGPLNFAESDTSKDHSNLTEPWQTTLDDCEPFKGGHEWARDDGPVRKLVTSAIGSPLLSIDQQGISMRVPPRGGRNGATLSVPHLSPQMYGALYRSLTRAPVVLRAESDPKPLAPDRELGAEQIADLARSLSSEQLFNLLGQVGQASSATKENGPMSVGSMKQVNLETSSSKATASLPLSRHQQVKVSLSADNASSLIDMIGRLASSPSANSESTREPLSLQQQQAHSDISFGLRKTSHKGQRAETPDRPDEEVRAQANHQDLTEMLNSAVQLALQTSHNRQRLTNTTGNNTGEPTMRAHLPAGTNMTNVLNLRVQQVAGDQVLANSARPASNRPSEAVELPREKTRSAYGHRRPNTSKRPGSISSSSSSTSKRPKDSRKKEPLSASKQPSELKNHRTSGRVQLNEDLMLATRKPATYLFQPLLAPASEAHGDESDHAARWNNISQHLGDNLAADGSRLDKLL